jgi:hypothetical protein
VSDGFRVLALDDTGRDVELPNDPTEETTMQPSALAMAVGALCRPGGMTAENQRRVEEAILAPRMNGGLGPFSAGSVDRPQALTDDGREVRLTYSSGAPRLSPEAERQQAIRLARENLHLAERRVMECEVALYEAEGRGDAPYARMRRAQLDGDATAEAAATVEFYADLHETNGTHPPPSLADAVTTLIAKRRIEREQH